VCFAQCSWSGAGSLNPLLLSSKWLLAALPHHRECTNLHLSSYLDQNRYHARFPQHRKIPHREELYSNMYIPGANWQFEKVEFQKCYRLGLVACRAVVELALESALCVRRVQVHLFHCISSMSADYLWCPFGKEGSRPLGFYVALPGVFASQSSPFCAQATQHPASSVLGPRHVVCYWSIYFPRLQRAKSLLWPFWPYSTSGACRTVPAVPNLLALP